MQMFIVKHRHPTLKYKLIISAFTILFFVFFLASPGKRITKNSFASDTVEELQKEINELEKLKKMSEDATGNLESSVKDLSAKINHAQASITQAKTQAEELAKSIADREDSLVLQYEILNERVAVHYKRMRSFNPIMVIFSNSDVSSLTKDLAYNSRVQSQDTQLIDDIATDIFQLEEDKKAYEQRQVQLASLQKQLDEQKKFFEKEIAGAKEYQQELGSKIAALSAKQQAIISSRTGAARTSVGDIALVGDFNASIGYKDKAPSNSFAVFSFGAYTHRNGMSQYGANARAKAGQSVEDILKAYYPNAKLKKDYSAMGSITVDGVGSIDFEDRYLMGIYEMPVGWHINAYKAQAIAARTYAIRYTNNGSKSICTTEACQVFRDSPKGGDWEKAVNDTKHWVLVDDGGNPVSTQYASLHGGYTNTMGWDLKGDYSPSNWTTIAWDNIGESPWFYRGWYRSGYSNNGSNCGRSHPWMSQKEMSDILNAWIVRSDPNGADTGRIVPVTINECNIGGGGGDPYSMDELRDWASKSSKGAVTSISSVSSSHSTKGQTTQVKFQTNRGEISMSGSEFKEIFNLRAPGYLRIPQTGFSFFNVEHKK